MLMVMFIHGRFMLKGTFLEGFPWIRLTDGVELFFVLSGFLIGQILLKILHSKPRLSFADLNSFWKRRWLRTLPNYYLFLLINMAFAYAGITVGEPEYVSYHYFIFTQNILEPLYGFFWESWSMPVEEWFYLLFPALLFLLARVIKPERAFLLCAALFLILPFIYRLSITTAEQNYFEWDTEVRKMVFTRLDSVFYGVIAAWGKWKFPSLWKRHARWMAAVGFIILALLTNLPVQPGTFFYQTFYFNVLGIGAMLLLPAADGFKRFDNPVGRIITRISIISYSMYLINLAPLAHVIEVNWSLDSTAESLLAYLFFWVTTIAVAEIVNRYFEQPILSWRNRHIPSESDAPH